MPKKKVIKELPEENQFESIVDSLKEYLHSEEEVALPREYLHTGNYALDYIISGKVDGSGGYPMGMVCELFGDPATGKSLLLAKAIAEGQKKDYLVVIADAEGRWDDDFAILQGVDIKEAPKFYPETVEEFATKAYQIFEKFGNKKRIVMILDSLAILTTIKELEDIEEGEMKMDQGRKAQRIKAAIRTLRTGVRRTGSLLLISNHVIAQPGAYTTTTPGGKGVSFQASVRVELTKPTPIVLPGKDRPIGVTLYSKITKNSTAPPFGTCEMNLYWATGVDPYSGLLDLMKDNEIVTQKGAWYYYGEKSFQSKDLQSVIQEHPEILTDEKWAKPYFLLRR